MIDSNKELQKWDIYEISSENENLRGIKLRGRIRKFCIENSQNMLVENTQDIENAIRFAIPTGQDATKVNTYIRRILENPSIKLIREKIQNPVLSKLKVNLAERYET